MRRYLAEHPDRVREYAARLARRVHPPKVTARDITCPRCSAAFRAVSYWEKYCPRCRPEAARECQREWKRRQRRPAHDATPSGGENSPT
jgi:predicted amidophosphoribosyltransferase